MPRRGPRRRGKRRRAGLRGVIPLLDEGLELFRALGGVVTPGLVRLNGSWTVSHEPGNPAILHCHYRGTLDVDASFVGLVLLSTPGGLEWFKAPGRAPHAGELEVEVLGWTAWDRDATVIVRLNGAACSARAHGLDEPPASCEVHEGTLTTGEPHVLFRLPTLTCALCPLLSSNVSGTRRPGLWRLHRALADALSPPLARLMTEGRSGHVP